MSSFDDLQASVHGAAPFELYRFTMGEQAWYLTPGEEARTYLTQTYAPEPGLERDEVEHNKETSSGSFKVRVALESALAAEFISFAPPEPMWLTVFQGHDGDPEVRVHARGRVTSAVHTDVCELTVEPSTTAIRKKIPPMVYQQSCNRMHGSPECGVVLEDVGMTIKVAAIEGLDVVVDMDAPESTTFNIYFTWGGFDETNSPTCAWGFIKSPTGHRMMVAKHSPAAPTSTPERLTMKAPVPGLQVGDVVTVYPGCRRTLKHCEFYGKVPNYMGFDIMPSSNPFTGVV